MKLFRIYNVPDPAVMSLLLQRQATYFFFPACKKWEQRRRLQSYLRPMAEKCQPYADLPLFFCCYKGWKGTACQQNFGKTLANHLCLALFPFSSCLLSIITF